MEDEEVAALVSSSPVGNAGTLITDGSRRTGILLYGFDPSKKDFDKKVQAMALSKFLDVIKTFFRNGTRTLYLPLMLHTTFSRGKKFMDATMNQGIRYFFYDSKWLSFYQENNVKVRCYGDREFIRERNCTLLLEFMQDIEEKTTDNDGGTLLIGFACTRSLEEARLSSIGIDFFRREGRPPTKLELTKAYYGIDAPEIGFLVRSCEIRDSDLQPVLVTGPKIQMYFPVIPLMLLSKNIIRHILYDLIVNRISSRGMKLYSKKDLETADTLQIKKYYQLNKNAVLGLGIRDGPFWVPTTQIKMPKYGRNGKNQRPNPLMLP